MHVVNHTQFTFPLALPVAGPSELRIAPQLLEIGPRASVEIEDKDWEKLCANPAVQRLLDARCITVSGIKPAARAPSDEDVHGIGSMTAAEAMEYLELVDDLDALETMLRVDERKSVRAAIKRRMGALAS